MAEINNNISGYNIKGRENLEIKNVLEPEIKENEIEIKHKNPVKAGYVPDTGVLGRSQVRSPKYGDMPKSIDEAVVLAEKNPLLLLCSESMFDCLYEKFLNQGMKPSEAYTRALIAEEELLEIGKAYTGKSID